MPNQQSPHDIFGTIPNDESLPVYSLSPQDFKDDVKFDTAIQAIVDSGDTKKALRDAINDLKTSAHNVELSFRKVGKGLDAAAKVSKRFASPLLSFHERWTEYHKDYVRLLWESRVVAGHARATANDFAGDFVDMLSDDSVSLADKKEEIQGYKEQLLEDQKKAARIAQGFTDLQSNVATFLSDITKWMEDNNVAQVVQEIHQILDEIDQVQKEIEVLRKQIVQGIVGSVGLGGCAAGLAAIGVVCPLLWIVAAASAVYATRGIVKVVKNWKLKREDEKRLRDALKRYDEKQDVLNALSKIEPILQPLKNDIKLISEKLVVFSTVWSCIHADLVEIEQGLDKAQSSKTKTLFKNRLQTTAKVYKLFNSALYQYETAVHQEDIDLGQN